MKKQAILTDGAPLPVGAYSQGLRVGDFVYVSGQVGRHPVTGELAEGIKEQTVRTLENVLAILQAGGATFEDVVKSTVHLKDMTDFVPFNEVYDSYFPDPKPVRTTVGSYLPKALVEIDVVAYAPIQN
ncbi:RidA family protein [Paenibacillus sp. V4I5]|uniref:RidA family protein n=1 Tax=Paenibacillus sp. V4I5 TaxID=3042306 RepID=UPI00279062AF|nr:Rid family detoxifying hydrolase [Paenibacillus sp. V4I5]MDQ0920254.1 2-iminobutanoate/2-iminopropanoate deaminase [Paenibacillus sp. V4I5]